MKVFLTAAFLAAISIPASAGQISDQASGGALSRGSRTIARNHNPNSIYDRWGNLRGGRDTDAFPLPRKHSYGGIVTLVR
jgi:hypothetical protein